MSNYFNVTFIGSGNVAWHLAQALEDAGHSVIEVYSRTMKNAKTLCDRLYDSTPTTSLDFSESKASIFIIAVPDRSISSIIDKLVTPPDTIIVHTSGTQPLTLLHADQGAVGVFYPVQTFSKKKKVINFSDTPFCIESNEKWVEEKLILLAKSLTRTVYLLDSEQRKTLHISCVFANNFINHLLTIAKELLESRNLDFELIKPLIIETVQKALEMGPENVQTGPAARKDLDVVQSHLNFLEQEPLVQEIYKAISSDILKSYH